MAKQKTYDEQSCGGCGCGVFRIRAARSQLGAVSLADVALVCCGCGSVTHLVPRTFIDVAWGRPQEGEKDDGVLAPMSWPRDEQGRPTFPERDPDD